MNPSDTPKGHTPELPLSPEDDPVLQTIEAHEARPEDLYPKPAPVVAPIVAPIVAASVAAPVVVKKEPPKITVQQPKPIKQVVETPQTIASKMADVIQNSPASRKPFQFFIHQKVSKKSLIVVFIVIGLILVGVGIYVVTSSPL